MFKHQFHPFELFRVLNGRYCNNFRGREPCFVACLRCFNLLNGCWSASAVRPMECRIAVMELANNHLSNRNRQVLISLPFYWWQIKHRFPNKMHCICNRCLDTKHFSCLFDHAILLYSLHYDEYFKIITVLYVIA